MDLVAAETRRIDICGSQVSALEHTVRAEGDAIFARWAAMFGNPAHLPGGRNLADYLSLRRSDLTQLQDELSTLGLSSLGRAESRIAPTLAAVRATLDALQGRPAQWPEPGAFMAGAAAIAAAQAAMFGTHARPHATRIMVTLPAEAAADPGVAARLVEAGATCFRINCAHDGPDAWQAMAANVRHAAAAAGRTCPVLMDIAGPKIRIVAVENGRRLHVGDRFHLLKSGAAGHSHPAVSISHPEIASRVESGARVWIDDGKIGARVVKAEDASLLLEVEIAREKGVKLKPEKGVNFPGVELDMPPLGDTDYAALDAVARLADLVGYSFVQRPADLPLLQDALAARRPAGAPPLPILLKIETPLAVRNLPELLVAAGARNPVGVMIARGDLAMEVGLERLSELQEEILWLCEAAHVPVVWATQVLETMMKTGAPSRAEVTDAAMGQRAECVMLNKGPHAVETVRFLAGVLKRMDRHQFKKSARLSALTAWRGETA